MRDFFLYRDDHGVILVMIKGEVCETIFDYNILTYHTKVVLKNDFRPLKYTGPPITSLYVSDFTVIGNMSGSPTQFPIYGTGIRGIISSLPSSKTILSPLILPTELHIRIFEVVSHKTLIYIDTNSGLESVIYGWNCIYNIINSSDNGKLLTPISPDKIRMLRNIWWTMNGKYTQFVSPINLILKLLGFDSIINLTTQNGIIMSEHNNTGHLQGLSM